MLTRLGLLFRSDLNSQQYLTGEFAQVMGLAQAAELAGFDSIWVTDRVGSASEDRFEAYTLLGALAVCTQTARLGALGTRITTRAPGVLAKQVTALDVLSSGRAVLGLCGLGIGAGQDEEAGETDGQLDRFEEALQVVKALLAQSPVSGEEVSFKGRYYQLEGAPNRPRPVQEGGLPILIGSSEQKSLKLIAKYADACTMSGDLPTVRRELSSLDRHMETLDRNPSAIARTVLVTVDATDPSGGVGDRLIENVAEYRESGIDGVIVEILADGDVAIDAEQVSALGGALN